VILIAALALAGALGAAGIAIADTAVSGEGGITPSKLPKNKLAPVALTVIIETTNDNANGVPDPLTHVLLNFDDDGTIATKGLPICKKNINNTTTQQALQMCGRAKVGGGEAIVRIPTGDTTHAEYPAVITAFNGPKKNGNPTILLHSRADDLGVTLVVVGTIKNSNAGGDYGKALDVPIPPLPANAQLARFETTVKKTWKYRGRKMSYVSASCHDRNHSLDVLGRAELGGGATSPQTATFSQKCKVKK
jgi:hypothetical protein